MHGIHAGWTCLAHHEDPTRCHPRSPTQINSDECDGPLDLGLRNPCNEPARNPPDPGLMNIDRDNPRAGILTLAMYPTLDQEQMDAVRAEEARLGAGLMFEFTLPEWAENPFGKLDDGPFNPGEDFNSDTFIEEVPPGLPWGDDDLEEELGEEAQDREGEGGGENPPPFVPFDQIVEYDYVDLAADKEEQADSVIEHEYIDLAEEEDEPRQREKRGLRGPVYRPRQRPRPRPRPVQGPRRGTSTGGRIHHPT